MCEDVIRNVSCNHDERYAQAQRNVAAIVLVTINYRKRHGLNAGDWTAFVAGPFTLTWPRSIGALEAAR